MAMKACPVCRMEQSDENQTCQACGAVFDDSPQGATMPKAETPPPDDNGDDDENGGEEETEETTETDAA